MHNLPLRLTISLLPLVAIAAAAPPKLVTPMTPDVVEILQPDPSASGLHPPRGNGSDARRDQALHRHLYEEGNCQRANPALANTL